MKIRRSPCAFCPYRRDVPSGVWDVSEYKKLIEYDKPTGDQPAAIFLCHEAVGSACCGWAQCHGEELLALRIGRALGHELTIPEVGVPLFRSGEQASVHGMSGVRNPPASAKVAIAKLLLKRRTRMKKPLAENSSSEKIATGSLDGLVGERS